MNKGDLINEVAKLVGTRVHSPEMVERVKRAGVNEGVLYSASGTYTAAVKVWSGLAGMIAKTVWELCQGRVIVVLCGGSRRDLAFLLIPKIIRILPGE